MDLTDRAPENPRVGEHSDAGPSGEGQSLDNHAAIVVAPTMATIALAREHGYVMASQNHRSSQRLRQGPDAPVFARRVLVTYETEMHQSIRFSGPQARAGPRAPRGCRPLLGRTCPEVRPTRVQPGGVAPHGRARGHRDTR